ncbi:MAG: patatin-like phospholipase family protein [Gammaproteobacteria bacterium]
MDSTPIVNAVFEGGGVKGIAYAGVIERLEQEGLLQGIERVAGSSAGGITAMLLGLGYTASEIKSELQTMNFLDFQDSDSWSLPLPEKLRLLVDVATKEKMGANKGDVFYAWAQKMIEKKLGNANATFADLDAAIENKSVPGLKHMFFTGTELSDCEKSTFNDFSHESHPNMKIADAVRITMSFPGAFEAVDMDGKRYADGGINNNFPVEIFQDKKYYPKGYEATTRSTNPGTIGIRVDSKDEFLYFDSNRISDEKERKKYQKELEEKLKNKSSFSLLKFIKSIFIGLADDKQKLKQYKGQVVQIYDEGIDTLDFNMTNEKKQRLVKSGSLATDQYLINKTLSIPSNSNYTASDLESLYKSIENKNTLFLMASKITDQLNHARSKNNKSDVRNLSLNLFAVKKVMIDKKLIQEKDIQIINSGKHEGVIFSNDFISKVKVAFQEEYKESPDLEQQRNKSFLVISLYNKIKAVENTPEPPDDNQSGEINTLCTALGLPTGPSTYEVTVQPISGIKEISFKNPELQQILTDHNQKMNAQALKKASSKNEPKPSEKEIQDKINTLKNSIKTNFSKLNTLKSTLNSQEKLADALDNFIFDENDFLMIEIKNKLQNLKSQQEIYKEIQGAIEIKKFKGEPTEFMEKKLKEINTQILQKKSDFVGHLDSIPAEKMPLDLQDPKLKALSHSESLELFKTAKEVLIGFVGTQFDNFNKTGTSNTIDISMKDVSNKMREHAKDTLEKIKPIETEIKKDQQHCVQLQKRLDTIQNKPNNYAALIDLRNRVDKTLRERASGTNIQLTKWTFEGVELVNKNRKILAPIVNGTVRAFCAIAWGVHSMFKFRYGSPFHIKELLGLKTELDRLRMAEVLPEKEQNIDLKALPGKYGLNFDSLRNDNKLGKLIDKVVNKVSTKKTMAYDRETEILPEIDSPESKKSSENKDRGPSRLDAPD